VKIFAVFVLVLAVLPPANADTLVTSGGFVTEIEDLMIDGTPYNVTFGSTDDMTFASNAGLGGVAAGEIAQVLGSFEIVSPDIYETDIQYLFVDRGDGNCWQDLLFIDPAVISPNTNRWIIGPLEPTDDAKSLATNPGFYFAEFSNLEPAPEPDSIGLALEGIGSLALLVVLKKRARRIDRNSVESIA
jgi:hypothetical protein